MKPTLYIEPPTGGLRPGIDAGIAVLKALEVYDDVRYPREGGPDPREHVLAMGVIRSEIAEMPKRTGLGVSIAYIDVTSPYIDPNVLGVLTGYDAVVTTTGMGLGALTAALGQIQNPDPKLYFLIRNGTAISDPVPPRVHQVSQDLLNCPGAVRAQIWGQDRPEIPLFYTDIREDYSPHGSSETVALIDAVARAIGTTPDVMIAAEPDQKAEIKSLIEGSGIDPGPVKIVTPLKNRLNTVLELVQHEADWILGTAVETDWPHWIDNAGSLGSGVAVATRADFTYFDLIGPQGTNRVLELPTPTFKSVGGRRLEMDYTTAARTLLENRGAVAKEMRLRFQAWTKSVQRSPTVWAEKVAKLFGVL